MSWESDQQRSSVRLFVNERLVENEKTGVQKLYELVGIESVKNDVKQIIALRKLNKTKEKEGLDATEISQNYVFKGNPGTCKTTVARIFAQALYEEGITRKASFVEAGRADLVGRHVGETAIKTKKVVESAVGGVLFIDEAYSLVNSNDDSFGEEAVDTLTHLIENYNDNLIVILAGYGGDMDKLISRNSGLQSRFGTVIEFPDYTPEELYDIAKITVKNKGFEFGDDVKDKLIRIFKDAIANNADFGNGRFVRNIVDKAIKIYALSHFSDDEDPEYDFILTADDFVYNYKRNSTGIKIGF